MRSLCVLLGLVGCGGGVAADPGLDARLRVDGGTFVRGPLPGDGDGPGVVGAFLTQTRFRAGMQHKSFNGVLEAGATAAGIALEGDLGFWIVPAGYPPPESPTTPSFDAPLAFSRQIAPGAHRLHVWAVDASDRFGVRRTVDLTLTGLALPDGALVVSLFWDNDADLDLHVVTPDGTEIYRGNPAGAGGRLDVDSNAQCRNDGRRNENVFWDAAPPSGRYVVRVDTFSLCSAAAARWSVAVQRSGERIAEAAGASTASATLGGHERGAGVLALEIDVP